MIIIVYPCHPFFDLSSKEDSQVWLDWSVSSDAPVVEVDVDLSISWKEVHFLEYFRGVGHQ